MVIEEVRRSRPDGDESQVDVDVALDADYVAEQAAIAIDPTRFQDERLWGIVSDLDLVPRSRPAETGSKPDDHSPLAQRIQQTQLRGCDRS